MAMIAERQWIAISTDGGRLEGGVAKAEEARLSAEPVDDAGALRETAGLRIFRVPGRPALSQAN